MLHSRCPYFCIVAIMISPLFREDSIVPKISLHMHKFVTMPNYGSCVSMLNTLDCTEQIASVSKQFVCASRVCADAMS